MHIFSRGYDLILFMTCDKNFAASTSYRSFIEHLHSLIIICASVTLADMSFPFYFIFIARYCGSFVRTNDKIIFIYFSVYQPLLLCEIFSLMRILISSFSECKSPLIVNNILLNLQHNINS